MKNTGIMYDSTEQTPLVVADMEYLLPPLSTEQLASLEADILRNGCYSPIVVDQNLVVIDGHHRWKLCRKHNLPYRMAVFEFADLLEAKQWALETQKGRRNMTLWELGQIALKLKPELEEKGRANQSAAGGDKRAVSTMNSTKAPTEHIDTRQRMADSVGISADSMGRVMKIESKAPAVVREALGRNELSLNQAYKITRKVADLPEEEREESAVEEMKRLKRTKGTRKMATPDKIGAMFNKAFELSLRLEATEENVERWVAGCRMTEEDVEKLIEDSQKLTETFYNISNTLRRVRALTFRRSESAPSDSGENNPEVKTPKADTPETETLEAETPEADTPEMETTKADTPEEETPEAETPEVEILEAETPEAGTPEAETPEEKEEEDKAA